MRARDDVRDNTRLLSGVYEALVGAEYLSGVSGVSGVSGMRVGTRLRALLDADSITCAAPEDAVSRVQELEQKLTKRTPVYTYHGDRCRVDTWWGEYEAVGSSKKLARRAAAQAAFDAYPVLSTSRRTFVTPSTVAALPPSP